MYKFNKEILNGKIHFVQHPWKRHLCRFGIVINNFGTHFLVFVICIIYFLLKHSHCIKYARIRVFSNHIFPYNDRIYGKIPIRENPYSGIIYSMSTFSHNPFLIKRHHKFESLERGVQVLTKNIKFYFISYQILSFRIV